jgi:transcriptional regulator with XRE-family HTH domain
MLWEGSEQMTTKWKDVRRHGPDDPRVRAGVEAAKAAERLAALRESRSMTQTAVAERMGIRQPTLSDIERRDDVYLSTLKSYVAALGGRLRLVADFDDESIEIAIEKSEKRELVTA